MIVTLGILSTLGAGTAASCGWLVWLKWRYLRCCKLPQDAQLHQVYTCRHGKGWYLRPMSWHSGKVVHWARSCAWVRVSKRAALRHLERDLEAELSAMAGETR